MVNEILVRPPGTSWMSVLGGWIATIGAAVLVAPAVAGILARVNVDAGSIAPAVPVVVGIFASYLIGGYVAGRMAGYRTSWHGMLTSFFSLLVLLLVALLGYAVDDGLLAGAGVSSLTDLAPGLRDLNVDGFGAALTFGSLIGFLAAIFAGWLGGVLAPVHAAVPVAAASPLTAAGPAPAARAVVSPPRGRAAARRAARERRAHPSFARKGGERVTLDRQETKNTPGGRERVTTERQETKKPDGDTGTEPR